MILKSMQLPPFLIKLIEMPENIDEQQRMTGHLLAIYALISMVSISVSGVLVLVASPGQFLRPVLAVFTVNTFLGVTLFLLKRGKVRLVNYLVIGGFWLLATLFSFTGGGVHSAAYSVYIVLIFLAGITLGGRGLVSMLVLCGFTGLGLVYLDQMGRLPEAQYQFTQLTFWLANFSFILILAFLQYYSSRTMQDSLKQAKTELTERIEAEREMAYRQSLLETVIRLGKNVTAINALPACLYEIYRIVRFELGFDRVGIFLYESASGSARRMIGTGRQGQVELEEFDYGQAAQIPVFHDALQDPHWIVWGKDIQELYQYPPEDAMYGVKEQVCLAAWAGDVAVGLISVDNLLSGRAIEPAKVEALELFAGYAGLAISNAQHHATLEQRVQERTEQLSKSDEQNRLLFEESPDAITLLNLDGKIVRSNQAYEVMTGIARPEMLGKSLLNLGLIARDDSLRIGQDVLRAAAQGGSSVTAEYVLISAGGAERNVESRIYLLTIGGAEQVLMTTRDITIRKQAEYALLSANQELERAMRMKDEFLASMSHELRTPLTGILGISESLQYDTYGPLNDAQRRVIGMVESSGRHLLELINDILDVSKLEAGKLVLAIEPVSLNEVCQASIQLVKGMAQKKKQRISFAMNPMNVVIQADGRRLKQIVVNLLSNAVKYTQEGGSLALEIEGNTEEHLVCISVQDTGIGIKPEDLQKLFKPFVQVDSSLSRQQSGTGLGLSLVKHLTELHGGRIEVESTYGEGSRFSVYMPWFSV